MSQQKRRIVVKVGTSTLNYANGKSNLRHMSELVKVLSDLMNSGIETVLVTSGAIGVGAGKLGMQGRPGDTLSRQAAATVGQCELMTMYDRMFSEYNYPVGQLLITKTDVDDDVRRHNLINAFAKLFELNVVPIVNENDCVAVEEIVYGDNDCLSAIVAKLVGADTLIILTDIDGLFDDNPTLNPQAKLISSVEHITEEMESHAGGAGTHLGTGGMATKLHAARIATEAGIDTYIINGTPAANIYKIIDNEPIGTYFKAVKP